jgi:hypothetical protein
MSALRELEDQFEEEKYPLNREQAEDSVRDFSDELIDVRPRALPATSVFGPPYGFEWTKLGSSAATARADKATGNFRASELVGPTAERFQTESALGLALRSLTTVTVRVSAYADHL